MWAALAGYAYHGRLGVLSRRFAAKSPDERHSSCGVAGLRRFTVLSLSTNPFDSRTLENSSPSNSESVFRYAFLALLAFNTFLISGAVCFTVLYFWH
jgi:hypothetical protein